MKGLLLRAGLFLAGGLLFVYAISSLRKGKVFIRGRTYYRENSSSAFWFSLVVLFVFSITLIVAALLARVQ